MAHGVRAFQTKYDGGSLLANNISHSREENYHNVIFNRYNDQLRASIVRKGESVRLRIKIF